jgi:hypothetical protein
LALRDEAIAKLTAAAAEDKALRARHETKTSQVESARTDMMQRVIALEAEHSRLTSELAAKDQALAENQLGGKAELQLSREKLVIAEQAQAALRTEVARLQADLQTREEEMTVLHAHLELARRSPESADAETRRLMEEAVARTKMLEQVREENRNLTVALERARGALEEREFLIRRLERSESNNANALGRIQTSIERMGVAPGLSANTGAPAECLAELVRMDGDERSTHVLGRRTRVGRAPGCEIRIDSSSVSRHHALFLVGVREVIIEDLNSTNGVLVNGRKVTRQLLSDGDLLTIGEAQFKLYLKVGQWPPDSPATRDAPLTPDAAPTPGIPPGSDTH